jgi:4-amino-4-deoxy-L-arabinose transferase-like glycosyltransferase
MTDPRRFRLVDLVLFFVVVFTAAGARVGYLITYADNASNDGPLLVQDPMPPLDLAADSQMRINERDALISNIKEHHWFGSLAPFAAREEQTSHVAPGYPWLVGELARILPEDFGPVERIVRWVQCVLGALTAGLWYLIARRAFPGRVVAVLTGVLCAVHPFWIVNTPAIDDGVLTTFLLAACLFLAIRGSQVEGALTSLGLGLGLAGLALLRAALLPFAVVGVLWFVRRGRKVPGGWQVGLLAVLGFIIGLAPWMVRNAQVFGDIFPIVDSTYLHLWMGNTAASGGGPATEQQLRDAWEEGVKKNGWTRLEHLPMLQQPARYRQFGKALVDDVQADPLATVRNRLWAGLYFFFGQDWFKNGRLWQDPAVEPSTEVKEIMARSPFPAMLLGFLLGMLLLGVLGWRWTFAWRKEAQPLALAVMWIPLPYLLSHAESLSGPRLPLDGVLLCYSAFVLACLAPNVARSLLRPRKREL